MANLSQIKRARMLEFLKKIKAEHSDDESLIAISEIENELTEKKYGLVWEQHEEAVDVQMRDNVPVFTEVKEREIKGNPDSEDYNFLLEGDNLHSLKLLEKTHKGKIDVIYIDVPYNTGNKDFIYDDCYVGNDDSFKHSKWLSFIYSRLSIAQRLLSDRGCIFISIDDNEQANLKLLCDSIFGEEKFVALIPWRKRTAKSDVPYGISQDYESIICYANFRFKAGMNGKERKYYETDDFPNKPWRYHDLTKQTTVEERPNSGFTIINPKNGAEYPANPLRSWAITKETFDYYYSCDRIIFPGDYDFLKISKPVLRYWKEDDIKKAGADFGLVAVSTFLPFDEVGMTQDGTKEIVELFGEKKFSFPKPVGLIKYLLKAATMRMDNALILDFFVGSGTTGQAVIELNEEMNTNHRFIICTNNENSICTDITFPRLRTVITGDRTNGSKYSEGIPSNLKYYKTDFIPKTSNDEEYSVEEKLTEHIKEMIQLEWGTSLDDDKYVLLFTDEDADALEADKERLEKCKGIYISSSVMLTSKQELAFANIPVHIIPDYYFDEELREVGEL